MLEAIQNSGFSPGCNSFRIKYIPFLVYFMSEADTRCKLLANLTDRGYGKAPLAEMQKIIGAGNSDLYDVQESVP